MYDLLRNDPGSYEPEVTSLVCALGSQWARWNFVDVGANIGYFPVILKSLFGESLNVDAFEPHPEIAAMCAKGVKDWPRSAKTHQIAISRISGTAQFYLSAKTDTSNSLNSRFRRHKKIIDVQVSTLDEVLMGDTKSTVFDSQYPTVLKIDVESTEPDVLAGGTKFIEEHRPHIICEILAGRTEMQVNEFCSANSYKCFRFTKDTLIEEREVLGDPTYEFRDWYLCPSDLDETTARNFNIFQKLYSPEHSIL